MADIQHKNITGLDAMHPAVYPSESDPTNTLGAYRLWYKPSTGELKMRNAGNTAWEDISITGSAADSSGLTSHLAATTDAHDASAISFSPTGTVAATDVQAAIAEVASEAATGASGHTIQDEGSSMTARTNLNFTGAGVSVTDDAANDQTDVEIPGGLTDPATETDAGIIELATQAEVNTGTDTTRAVTPATLAGRTASETQAGVIEIATQTEVNTGTDDARAVTAAKFAGRTATETRTGVVELATQSETNTGTDDTRAVTPLKLKTNLDLHVNDTSDAHDASAISIVDSGTYFTATDVEGALQELGAGGGGVADLDDLTDVVISSPATDDVLVYNGSNWVNDTVPGGGGSGYRTLVTLGSDVANSTTSFADVTGLSFNPASGVTYRFSALIWFEASATTIGSRWSIAFSGGAAGATLGYRSQWPSSTTATSTVYNNASDQGTATTGSAVTSANITTLEGIFTLTTGGTFTIRFASETGGTITAKAGSTLEYW